jgi:riboflavin kinase/FMN adenylyltransferase
MQIIRHYENVPEGVRGGVVVLGNFDGVHRGHQAVIGRGIELAHEAGLPLVVLTFEPHPRSFFRPHDAPFRLTPFNNKAHHIEALGIDALIVLAFDEALSGLEAEEFIQHVLVEGVGARQVVVGQDFRFGRQRGGDTALLEARAESGGFAVTTVAPVASADAEIYSSSHIREQLESGKPGHAAAMLGRPFEIEGEVGHGDKRGRTLGFPTANIDIGDYIRPARGVYAVRAGIDGGGEIAWVDGVANFGNRPTIGGDSLLLEVHLFDYDGDLYGRNLRVALIEYLRPERKFDGLDALKAQIDEDGATARRILLVRAAGAS